MGTRDQLAGLRSRLQEGPRAARVDRVEESDAEPVAGLTSFQVQELNRELKMTTTTSTNAVDCDGLKRLIREVPDFPKKGILFYDITTLLKDKLGFARLIDALSENYIGKEIDLVLGMEARGFIFGPALAYRLNAGFVPVRKPGKLPAETVKISYELEYGSNALEVHKDAIQKVNAF